VVDAALLVIDRWRAQELEGTDVNRALLVRHRYVAGCHLDLAGQVFSDIRLCSPDHLGVNEPAQLVESIGDHSSLVSMLRPYLFPNSFRAPSSRVE
jgi:hypothetical protein